MAYAYVYLLFFAVFSIAIPALFLFASKLMRENYGANDVKNAPYESGEETIGKMLSVDNEYFPFVMLFLPFEIIVVLALLFSSYLYSENFEVGMGLMLLIVIGMLFVFAGYALINYRDGGDNIWRKTR